MNKREFKEISSLTYKLFAIFTLPAILFILIASVLLTIRLSHSKDNEPTPTYLWSSPEFKLFANTTQILETYLSVVTENV